jgi:hypothetical protein
MKRDLLQECNDQRIPPKDFTQTFCVRCRNAECVNAGWASSSFEERVLVQVDRLLRNPVRARPEDSRFDAVRAQHFKEVSQAIVLRRREDPWAGPGVFLSEPDPAVVVSPTVEGAVARLAEARGKVPPTVEVAPPEPVIAPPAPPPVVVVAAPLSPPASVNTEFPEEGVMIGGAPPSPDPRSTESLSADPWAPKPKRNVVLPGAKIKMGQ